MKLHSRNSGTGTRAAILRLTCAYVEDEENVPDWLAEDAVVDWVSVPLTVAVVPDAVFVMLKLASPRPPATKSSSDSLSSIRTCIRYSSSRGWTRICVMAKKP
jgi:hypothetical protein